MFLCQEERFCEGFPIFGQPYPYGCNGFSSIKHLVHILAQIWRTLKQKKSAQLVVYNTLR